MKDAAILFLAIFALGLLVIMWREHRPPEIAVDTHNADYPICLTVKPPLLTNPRPGKVRLDYRTRDGGTA